MDIPVVTLYTRLWNPVNMTSFQELRISNSSSSPYPVDRKRDKKFAKAGKGAKERSTKDIIDKSIGLCGVICERKNGDPLGSKSNLCDIAAALGKKGHYEYDVGDNRTYSYCDVWRPDHNGRIKYYELYGRRKFNSML
ncbi:unnamed protein product [Hermetia illucens]|uniref:Uncharacterized protein n=1 Tax=Hermetia illucens TaxID=343691 RepID=A0A7R8UZU1_HERIL|nr:unnamed protein product [Hermetia illucens]